MRWVTEIRSWDPPTGFMDVQLRGPYRLWEHTQSFQAVDGEHTCPTWSATLFPSGYWGAWLALGS
jgi:ligand-binding SRPBCC domain-containing protein